MVMDNLIIVAAYPRSGHLWLVELLGQALDCPIGRAGTLFRAKVYAHLDRPGPWRIQGIHRYVDDQQRAQGLRVVVIVRDPRDIVVSTAHFWEVTLNKAMEMVGRGEAHRAIGRGWTTFVEAWLLAQPALVQYEDLLADTMGEMDRILTELHLPVDNSRMAQAIAEQSFTVRKAHIAKYGDPFLGDMPERHLRKGIVGDWRNQFDRALGMKAEQYFGSMMRKLGYTDNDTWWQCLSDRPRLGEIPL